MIPVIFIALLAFLLGTYTSTRRCQNLLKKGYYNNITAGKVSEAEELKFILYKIGGYLE